ncbi:hypothetical protein [Singulisphaera sp. GP187]|uniref:hypothetical protein n=1 Tax=Singulisphaera sp. GP187 TaxID=1882752 RepID=UPI0020B107BA|nr:hypothetical protein [Singulisphaera sp. GP187]
MKGASARHQWLCPWLALGFIAVATLQAGSQDLKPARATVPSSTWGVGRPLAIKVHEGRAQFQVKAPQPGSRTLVVVSALSGSAGPYPIRLTARGSADSRPPLLAPADKRGKPNLVAPILPAVAAPVDTMPPHERKFYVLARDGDVASASNYLEIKGQLRAVGERIQVYVDSLDGARVSEPVLRELVATFDQQVFPTAARTIGLARDADGDGRFTVLMSSWLARLAGGRHTVDGFVRGADLDPGFAAPFSNHCDMMYLNATLQAGPYLRTIVAHEYTHAVTYSAKTFTGPLGERLGTDEDGWLDEALAHLCEDLHGFSKSNLDYRISAFLSNPERYRLVVEDYYTADLFRSHGNRGSTYLFLRWCADRYGPTLLPALIRSPRHGTENLEAVTGARFADLYRQWSLALYFSGMDKAAPANGFRTLDVRASVDGWELAGPRTTRVIPDGGTENWSAAGTSSHFVVVDASPLGAIDVEISGPAEADLQVTAVPLPADLANLELRAGVESRSGGELYLRAEIRERDGTTATLSALAWEPLVPAASPHGPAFRRGKIETNALVTAFGTSVLPGRGTLQSRPIRLEGVSKSSGPLIVKATGIDRNGRRVAAWAEVALGGE